MVSAFVRKSQVTKCRSLWLQSHRNKWPKTVACLSKFLSQSRECCSNETSSFRLWGGGVCCSSSLPSLT